MTDAEPCFVDTNVMLAATDTARESYDKAVRFFETGLEGSERLFSNGQVFREYLVVATRPPDRNGLGLAPHDALANLKRFRQCLSLLEETDAVAIRLADLVAKYDLKGKRIHDANIVATMLENGLRRIRTENVGDFERFEGLQVEGFN